MSISKRVVDHPVMLLIIFILLIGLGLYASFDLALDLYPEINPPVLVIFTDYTGNGPEQIEKLVTRPLEGALQNVSNIEKIESISFKDTSQILIRFVWGTDMSEAANDVRDKLEFVKNFMPEDAGAPIIFKFDPSMIPIMYMAVTGDRQPEELRQIAEDIIQPRLEQVEGVAMAGVSGGREKVIRVEIPQNRLAAYDMTLTQIAQMMMGQNIQISAGSISEGNKNYLVSTSGAYDDVEQIKNTVIGFKSGGNGGGMPMAMSGPSALTSLFGGGSMGMPSGGGGSSISPIRLRDIANVYEGLRDEEDAVFINGQPGIYLTIQKQSGTNSVQTADNVKDRIRKLQGELPLGVSLVTISDTTKIIRNSLNQVAFALVGGALLAVIILLIFLRSIKSVIIIGVSIPISVIITMMLMYFFNLTLNIMTLSGLALGIGMLVDNSIVILENIYRYREKGTKPTTASILGSQEMINAIVASTLTTISVFAPVVMFRQQLGMMGELFSGLAFTVVISLASSLLVAIFLVPILTSKYLPINSRLETPLKGLPAAIDKKLEGFFTWIDNRYKKALAFVLNHRGAAIGVISFVFLGSLILIVPVGCEYIPSMEEDMIQLEVELPVGTKLDITKSVMDQFKGIVKEKVVVNVDGEKTAAYNDIITTAGEKSFFGFIGATEGHKGSMMVTLPPYNKRTLSSSDIKAILRKHFNDFPSAVFSFPQQQMGPQTSPVDVIVKSNDLIKARDTALRIKEILKDEEAFPQIREPDIDLNDGLPQIEVMIDRNKAYSYGLNMMTIGSELQANINGITATRLREGADEYDVLVILDERDRNELPDLNKIFVTSSSGGRIPMANFTHLERTSGPVNIKRENQMRVIHVRSDVAKRTDVGALGRAIEAMLQREITPDPDVVIEQSGDYIEMQKDGMKMFLIIIISVILVFGIMASQFESFLDPFIILFTIPLTFTGVIWMYALTFERLSLFTAVGMVVLVGVVVNNGIVLVDYTNLLYKRGYSIIEATIKAGANRLRPILMTTLTTILGLVPMAFLKGEGSDLSQPIAKTVIGGLTVSTFFTLFLIPIIYTLFNQFSEKRKMKRAARLKSRFECKQKLLLEEELEGSI
jgi:HAE1 family hydrophobic/amphiphilic exporter-1